MKTIITTLVISALTIFSATEADARPHRHASRTYISGYQSCGTPIYKERYFVGYDHYGRPIWRTRVIHRHFRPVSRPRYVAPCPPPYRGSRIVIQANFSR